MKKRFLSILLCSALAVGAVPFAQPTEVKAASVEALHPIEMTYWGESEDYILRYSGYTLYGSEKESYKDLQTNGLDFEKDYIQGKAEDMIETLISNADEIDSETTGVSINGSVARADSTVFSIRYRVSAQLNGEVQEKYIYTAAYDNTGNLLLLDEVVKDMDAFEAILKEKVEKYYPDYNADYLYIGIGTDFTVDYSGISVYLPLYDEVATYWSDIPVLFVSYEEAGVIIDSKFAKTPDAWMAQMEEDLTYYEDINNDGTFEQISAYGYYKKGNLVSNAIMIDGKEYEEERDDYTFDSATYVHNSDGKNYIYIINDNEDYDGTLLAYDVTSGKPKFVGDAAYGLDYAYDDDDNFGEFVPCDPEFFLLYESASGNDDTVYCEVGSDGMPSDLGM